MQINVNGKPEILEKPMHLSEFLERQQINTAAIAIAVNGMVVHRESWQERKLNNGDSLTIIQAVAGG